MNNHDFYSSNPYSIFDEMLASATRVMKTIQAELSDCDSYIINEKYNVPNKVDRCICNGDFPPSNIYTKDGDFCLDFACAGYTEDDINLKYKDNYLQVNFTAPKKDLTGVVPLKQGIRMRDSETVSVFIDSQKYDVSKIDVTLANGILGIRVKPNKSFVKEYAIGINGKAPKKLAIGNDAENAEDVPAKDKGKKKE